MTCKAAGLFATILLSHACVTARSEPIPCEVRARLASGWVCGVRRTAENGSEFASFLAVPYAKQPLGKLRFKELEPLEPWDYLYEATQEGPICPQQDVFYGRIMQPASNVLTEACIHANVHVPIDALPVTKQTRVVEFQPPHEAAARDEDESIKKKGLPIFVFIHGGGFAFGSGDTDLHGPEYLVSRGVIVITFNYRLNVFGFLSLNNSYVPGNNGLRDTVTLLRWVRTNARAFGGDPDDVTLGGHSAGAASAQLLTLSDAAKGLFKRVLIMSGNAISNFYTSSPNYAQFISNLFLKSLGITATDPEGVHRQLVEMPLEKILAVYSVLLDQIGLTVFTPVVESPHAGIIPMLDDDPEALIAQGRGKDIPLMVGFTSAECNGFLPRFNEIDILNRVEDNPIILVPPQLIYTRPPDVALGIAKRIEGKYFKGEPTIDQYVKYCSDESFEYPTIKMSQKRAAAGGAPVFLYEFSYEADFSVKKEADNTTYKGAAHLEDLTLIFRVNSILGPVGKYKPTQSDEKMREWMLMFVTNFIRCSDPACNRDRRPSFATPWPPVATQDMLYQDITMPTYWSRGLSNSQLDMMRFFDSLQNGTS